MPRSRPHDLPFVLVDLGEGITRTLLVTDRGFNTVSGWLVCAPEDRYLLWMKTHRQSVQPSPQAGLVFLEHLVRGQGAGTWHELRDTVGA